jgi:hypothetical protein
MTQMQAKTARWPWILVVVVVAGAGWFLFKDQLQRGQEQPAAAPVRSSMPQAPSAAPPQASHPAPAIQHPVNEDAADPALPALADSDAAVWDALAGVAGQGDALAIVLRDHLIQRIVVMVDNLTKPSITRRALALQPIPGGFQVEEGDGRTRVAVANAERYAPYVATFTSANADTVVAAYRRFYPLFQQAYVELGYPDGYFNDRLVQVLDHLLQAPPAPDVLEVRRDARGQYRFADPQLEALSIGQKTLVRLGSQQQQQVMAQLRNLRAALTRK